MPREFPIGLTPPDWLVRNLRAQPAPVSRPAVVRAAIAILLPLAVGLATRRPDYGALAAAPAGVGRSLTRTNSFMTMNVHSRTDSHLVFDCLHPNERPAPIPQPQRPARPGSAAKSPGRFAALSRLRPDSAVLRTATTRCDSSRARTPGVPRKNRLRRRKGRGELRGKPQISRTRPQRQGTRALG